MQYYISSSSPLVPVSSSCSSSSSWHLAYSMSSGLAPLFLLSLTLQEVVELLHFFDILGQQCGLCLQGVVDVSQTTCTTWQGTGLPVVHWYWSCWRWREDCGHHWRHLWARLVWWHTMWSCYQYLHIGKEYQEEKCNEHLSLSLSLSLSLLSSPLLSSLPLPLSFPSIDLLLTFPFLFLSTFSIHSLLSSTSKIPSPHFSLHLPQLRVRHLPWGLLVWDHPSLSARHLNIVRWLQLRAFLLFSFLWPTPAWFKLWLAATTALCWYIAVLISLTVCKNVYMYVRSYIMCMLHVWGVYHKKCSWFSYLLQPIPNVSKGVAIIHIIKFDNYWDFNSYFTPGVFNGVRPLVWIIVFGDSIHNFADGITLGAAIFHSLSLGLSMTVAIVLHEIPHEIGTLVAITSISNFWYSCGAKAGACMTEIYHNIKYKDGRLFYTI